MARWSATRHSRYVRWDPIYWLDLQDVTYDQELNLNCSTDRLLLRAWLHYRTTVLNQPLTPQIKIRLALDQMRKENAISE